MVRKSRDVTEAELSVLQVLWQQGPMTIREIAEILEPKRVDAYYSTVKKLLERLEAKGFVLREAAGIAFIYEATVARDELVGRRLREVAETLCEGSLTPLLTQLAQHHDLTKKQQKTLMDLINDLAKQEKR
ncbi:BlaI/MecI/CopY family transcriptional regulator [Gimesia aquarii]|uniref:Transcriptional repressor CopY n=1 Tax=Gimesia aquarii TaxID=2527964 RepID=A0A517WYU8_9PLAN|nr:BlaI/MecI/CopY family transcriptional regulator [Gimesia aquarii]QDU10411.1 Transcriptional repressor CopY [Gimesia aquarii]